MGAMLPGFAITTWLVRTKGRNTSVENGEAAFMVSAILTSCSTMLYLDPTL